MSKKKTKPTPKQPQVTRKFLLRLADDIYNPNTCKFLRLCDGQLQNGPDPTDKDRPMHCVLGELYFAMTGHQPNAKRVTESDVIDLAVRLSPLRGANALAAKRASLAIKGLNVSRELKDALLDTVNDAAEESIADSREMKFRAALDAIPAENDDDICGSGESCTVSDFRARSQRVAKQLRVAAKLLPA